MRDIAKEVYAKMKVGSVAWIDIEKVQRQADGLIDAIRIQRLA
jgi:hypothetical protein